MKVSYFYQKNFFFKIYPAKVLQRNGQFVKKIFKRFEIWKKNVFVKEITSSSCFLKNLSFLWIFKNAQNHFLIDYFLIFHLVNFTILWVQLFTISRSYCERKGKWKEKLEYFTYASVFLKPAPQPNYIFFFYIHLQFNNLINSHIEKYLLTWWFGLTIRMLSKVS